MTDADDWAAEAVDSYAREAPEILALAVAVSLASRVEPGLLRRARLELAPGVHAGAESELWHSLLVQHRSPKAIVFAPEVAWLLQQRLKDGERPGLAASWGLLRSVHAGLPEAIRLEEEIIWRAVRDATDPEIPARLRRAVRTLLDGDTPDLAQWAARALPRLPPIVRRTPEAWLLALAASSRLGGLAVLGEPVPAGLAADDLFWIAAQSAAQVPVYLRRKEGALLLSLRADGEAPASAPSLSVPATHPVLLEATAADGEPQLVALRPEEPAPVSLSLGAGGLRLRTAAGEVFRVEVPLAAGAAGLAKSAGALPAGSPVFFGREKELGAILAGIQEDSFLIVGPRRIGKTSLLNQVLHGLQERKGVRPLLIDCQGARRAEDLRPEISVLRSDPGNLKGGGSRTGNLFREVAWEAGGRGEQVVFLMNEIDGLVASDPAFIEDLHSLTSESRARFVFTGYVTARQAAEPDGVLGWVRPALKLGPLEPSAARALLAQLEGPELGVTWETGTREASHVRILERTYGLPWLLQGTCNGLLHRFVVSGAALEPNDVDFVLNELPALLPLLEDEIRIFAAAFGPEPATLAAQLVLAALAVGVPESAETVFNAETAADSIRRIAAQARDQRVWSRLTDYFARFSIDGLLAGLADSTLVLRRSDQASGFAVYYSFTSNIYPQELRHAIGGREGLEKHLFDLAVELAATLRPPAVFTTDPVDPADPGSPRVVWGDEGRACRMEAAGRSSGPFLLAEDDLLRGLPLVVTGEARAGCRSFLAWVRWLSESTHRFRLIVLDATHVASDAPPAESLVRVLIDRLRDILGQSPGGEALEELQSSLIRGSFRAALEWYGRSFGYDQPLVVVMLGLDALPRSLLSPLLSDLGASLERRDRWGNLILPVRNPQVLSPDSTFPLSNLALTCRLPFLNPAEIAGLWERFGPGASLASEAGSTGFAWTGGQPLLVQLFLREAVDAGGDFEEVGRRLAKVPPEVVSLWQRDLASILRGDLQARSYLQSVIQEKSPAPELAAEQLFHAGWIRFDPQRGWLIRSRSHLDWALPVLASGTPA